MKSKSMAAMAILAALLVGCNSESSTQPVAEQVKEVEKSVDPIITPVEPIPEPVVELTPLESVKEIEPPKPVIPIFESEDISAITQQPYSGVVIRGGDVHLRYDSGVEYFHDFELPEWTVEYKYMAFLEVLITNGNETLCARYSWKLKGFGYAKAQCNWSDTRAALPLTDVQAAYYGYSVVETRVWVSGVAGLVVEVE